MYFARHSLAGSYSEDRGREYSGRREIDTLEDVILEGAVASTQPLRIPPVLHDVETTIRQSQWILDVADDEDEGEQIAETTLTRANELLRRMVIEAWHRYDIRVKAPIISPGPDGSVDLLWKTGKRELLVNVSANDTDSVSYYGNDRTQPDGPIHNSVEGIAAISAKNDWLLVWLMQ